MKRSTRWFKSFALSATSMFSHFWAGAFLLFLAITNTPAEAFGSEDKMSAPWKAVRMIDSGRVLQIRKNNVSDQMEILLAVSPEDQNGKPVCNRAARNIVRVYIPMKYTHREPDAFVVLDNPGTPVPTNIHPGDCLTVEGVEWKPVKTTSQEDRITILPSKKGRIRHSIQAILVKQWTRIPTLEATVHRCAHC